MEDVPRSGRLVTVKTEENKQFISRTFHSNPQISQRCASHDLNISRTSLQYPMKAFELKTLQTKIIISLK